MSNVIAGNSGPLNFRVWKPGFSHKNAVVFHDGAYFIALADTRNKPPSRDWHELRPQVAPFGPIPHQRPRPAALRSFAELGVYLGSARA